MNNKQIAQVCHEVNRAYCLVIGDDTKVPWKDTPEAKKALILKGVEFHLTAEKTPPEESHQAWMDQMMADGWVLGEEKDEEKKTDPRLVPYDELPLEQKVKDHLFAAVVEVIMCMPKPEPIIVEKEVIVEKEAGKIPVRYIGKRPQYTDGAYQTGITWLKGETKMVPEKEAYLLLMHRDQYEMGELEEADTPVVKGKDPEDDKEEEEDTTRDLITQMDKKKDLLEFAKVNFGVDLDVDSKTKVAEYQAQCVRLLDQFGMPE